MELNEGDKAPSFKLLDQSGKAWTLSQEKGKWVVLYFYPKDMTSGCTVQAKDFTASLKKFEKLGAVVVGVSKDSVARHQKFIEKEKLKITLLSDEDAKVCQQFGVYQQKSLYGRKFMGIVRTTFVINPKGIIEKIFSKVKVNGHVEKVLESIS